MLHVKEGPHIKVLDDKKALHKDVLHVKEAHFIRMLHVMGRFI